MYLFALYVVIFNEPWSQARTHGSRGHDTPYRKLQTH